MPAMHLSSVLLPDPLRPTMPKNSPGGTANDTPLSASKRSWPVRRKGWSARSFSVWICSRGMLKVFDTPSTTTAGTPPVEALTRRNVAVSGVASARVAQPLELAKHARAHLPARPRSERMAGHEAGVHEELPQLVRALPVAQPARRRRPAVARQLTMHVREPPSGARQPEVHEVVLGHPLGERVAPYRARRLRPDRGRRAGDRVLLRDLREVVHRMDGGVADVVVVSGGVADDVRVGVREPHRRVLEAGEDALQVVGLPLIVGVEL